LIPAVLEHGELLLRSITDVAEVERAMLPMEQAPCPLVHHFGPNICIREVTMPAGALVVGHKQKFEQLNIMLRGKLMMLDEYGNPHIYVAPMIYTGAPGRKIAYILEETVWQNVYSTALTDVNAVEDFFIEKSEDWQQDSATKMLAAQTAHEMDRADHFIFMEEFGLAYDAVEAMVSDPTDQIRVDSAITRVLPSPIHGKGLFVTAPVAAGSVVCPARLDEKRTQAGRFVNHSIAPNCVMTPRSNGDIDLVALVDLEGCKGGSMGVELTVNYRQALAATQSAAETKGLLCPQ
jgi:hypothetical protein